MPQHVVIIGAVALGPKAAARFKRLEPDSRVTMIDRGKLISYGGCGIPYFVSGDVSDASELQTTAFHMLRDEAFFRDTKDVDVRTETEAVGIDREARTVTVRHLPTGREEVLAYDKLVLATGSTPSALSVPGSTLGGIHTVNGLEAAQHIRALVSGGGVSRAVVVGAGFIGLEMTVALADMWGVETTVIEFRDQILPGVISGNLARMAQRHMEDKGVAFRLGEQVRAFEAGAGGRVARVVTDDAVLEADLVIVAVGVRPNSGLARAAGLAVSERGGIQVDEHLRTSDPNIFAGGDCVELKHLITGSPAYLPLGSLANRQGRVIGTNLAGGAARFSGAVGSWCVKLFDISAAGTGLTLTAARAAGFDAQSVHVSQLDRAHFHPDKGIMSLDLVFEFGTGRVLGMQGLGVGGDALVGRVDVLASLLPSAPTVEDLGGLEMAYSPPFAAALDILNVLGNAAENILEGRNKGIQVDEFAVRWGARNGHGPYVLDCRERANAEDLLKAHPEHWHNIPQGELRGRLDEVPRDTGVVLICNTGARSYEAFVTLAHAGFRDVVSVEGGMTAVLAAGVRV
ncbi:MAG: FAD-dependent oxidoreductase [Humidesulfovibrio sp.]|uniref:FAD-dependent oxidoreductase n=1 Tax=Humidesulfovibrio sp. TaxID=2910988 RepID=UPI0027ECB650|nr:FAD-dependent oxidoreductase [Humidesulfovibrio sp.]MDQ7834981.1 FAD-dependent oxidoreductase [Humidesulfovibrio sp.]